MNKGQLIEQLSSQTGLTKADADKILSATLDSIKKAIKKNERVTLVGFGSFMKHRRKARKARNPKTGEAIKVQAYSVPKFKPGKEFKSFVN